MSFTPEKMPIQLPLFRGMNTPDVRKFQMWLNDLNEYYGFNKIVKKIPETGYFGDQTIQMVKEFQKFWGLPPSGMWDARSHDIMEWKFMNMTQNLAIRVQRQQQEAFFSKRHW